MKIFSSEALCHCISSSESSISSSCLSRLTVRSVLRRNTSETVRKCGLLSSITQVMGEIAVSQAVKAYSASIVLSGDVPLGKCTNISTLAAVLSSTFLIFILPFSLAFSIESISEVVVVVNGISVMQSVLLSSCEILARTRTRPPLAPSL